MSNKGLTLSVDDQKHMPLGKRCHISIKSNINRRTLTISSLDGTILYKKVVIML